MILPISTSVSCTRYAKDPDLARVEGEELPFAFQALRHTGNDIRIDDEEIRPSFDRERELMVTSDIEVHVSDIRLVLLLINSMKASASSMDFGFIMPDSFSSFSTNQLQNSFTRLVNGSILH